MASGRLALAAAAAAVVTGGGCTPRAPEKAGEAGAGRDAGTTRGALGAATGVREAAGAAGREFRVVPLGPMAGDVEILSGHPDSAGRPFVMRIRELPGTIVPPHSHPVDEHVTVVQGTWHFARGERFDSAALRAMPAGAYAFAPAGTPMFAASPEGAVVQVHGIGPFHIHWRDGLVSLADGGAAAARFHFRLGEGVTGARGAGVVRAGYASGAVLQYEVERPDGARYMATEAELRRP
jgi:quercetin dioxygenase-like cupin family protein